MGGGDGGGCGIPGYRFFLFRSIAIDGSCAQQQHSSPGGPRGGIASANVEPKQEGRGIDGGAELGTKPVGGGGGGDGGGGGGGGGRRRASRHSLVRYFFMFPDFICFASVC